MYLTGIIGGTGVYDPSLLDDIQELNLDTPYGSARVLAGKYQGIEIAFIARHGQKHSLPPHLVNYRANIMAFKMLGVKRIIGTAAVGSLHFEFKPGQFVLADQFIDFTKTRPSTFYEGGEQGVLHCDMTIPYCPDLREALVRGSQENEICIHNGGVYVCTEGPRFETSAEIAMFKQLGGHLIGMTSVPEVCLARELGMCYANISIVTNFAAGISPGLLTHSEVVDMMGQNIERLRKILTSTLKYVSAEQHCDCPKILEEVGLSK